MGDGRCTGVEGAPASFEDCGAGGGGPDCWELVVKVRRRLLAGVDLCKRKAVRAT